jgi:ribosomal protein S18 acetylase RimI-like enzyme
VGYALICLEQGPDDTFSLGERYAELYSLSVASRLRGRGIGTQLLDFVDRELARRSIDGLKVAVMAGNAQAERLYERRGLHPAELVLYRFAAGDQWLGVELHATLRPWPARSLMLQTPAKAYRRRARSSPSSGGPPRTGGT